MVWLWTAFNTFFPSTLLIIKETCPVWFGFSGFVHYCLLYKRIKVEQQRHWKDFEKSAACQDVYTHKRGKWLLWSVLLPFKEKWTLNLDWYSYTHRKKKGFFGETRQFIICQSYWTLLLSAYISAFAFPLGITDPERVSKCVYVDECFLSTITTTTTLHHQQGMPPYIVNPFFFQRSWLTLYFMWLVLKSAHIFFETRYPYNMPLLKRSHCQCKCFF
jgi:hypothetical protein